MNLIWALVVAFVGTCLLLWVLRPLALRIGLVDLPGGRKSHQGNIALIGGVAMFSALAFSTLLLGSPLGGLRIFFAGSLLLLIVGILDDFDELPAWSRFVAQVFAALMMIWWGGVQVTDVGAIAGVGTVTLGNWATPFTIFATIGVINAWNMSDGLDGLAGGLALEAFLMFGYIAISAGRETEGQLLFLLAGVVGAFLLFNIRLPRRPQALVFMGDAGSMFVGFALAWFAISLSQGENRAMTPVTALWILALPLIDAVSILIRRLSARRAPFMAARDHLHHSLLSYGFSVNGAVSFMLLLAMATGALGLLAFHRGLSEHLLFYGFLIMFAIHLGITVLLAGGDGERVSDCMNGRAHGLKTPLEKGEL